MADAGEPRFPKPPSYLDPNFIWVDDGNAAVRVAITRADGSTLQLEGEDAAWWMRWVEAACAQAALISGEGRVPPQRFADKWKAAPAILNGDL